MIKDEIISTQWLLPGEVWVCNECEMAKAKVKLLTRDKNGYLNIHYYCGFYEEDIEEWRVLDPTSKYYLSNLIEAFRDNITKSETVAPKEWIEDLRNATLEGLSVPEIFFKAAEDLLQGKDVTLEGDTLIPIGEWVTEPEDSPFPNVKWFDIKDIKVHHKKIKSV